MACLSDINLTFMNYDQLKTRHRAERGAWHPNLSLRVHRALSWLDRAEQLGTQDDADAQAGLDVGTQVRIQHFLSQHPLGELEEGLHILEFAHHPQRDPHRPRGFPVDAQAEIIQAEALGVPRLGEAGRQLRLRQTQCDLTRARVAETARPQRDAGLIGLCLDRAVVDRPALPDEEIGRHRPASPHSYANTSARVTVTIFTRGSRTWTFRWLAPTARLCP